MRAEKAIRLLSLLPKRPVEFYDRVMTVVEVKREGNGTRLPAGNGATFEFRDALSRTLNISAKQVLEILKESELQGLERKVAEAIARTNGAGPFDPRHNGDFLLARSAYVICRVLSPDVVVETGVAYGVTSAFTLEALAVNGKGVLHSIDLPPLGKDADLHVGAFIPQELKGRWRLYRGTARRLLPELLRSIGGVDLFIHDSLHTYRNMSFEFKTVWPYLHGGAALLSDDVGLNDGFRDFAAEVKPKFSAVIKEEEKDALFGMMAKGALRSRGQ